MIKRFDELIIEKYVSVYISMSMFLNFPPVDLKCYQNVLSLNLKTWFGNFTQL